MRALQVQLEEQEEKNKTLNQVNLVLRQQLESATLTNENLVGDIKRISENFNQLKAEKDGEVIISKCDFSSRHFLNLFFLVEGKGQT